jgi:hypothetical protein
MNSGKTLKMPTETPIILLIYYLKGIWGFCPLALYGMLLPILSLMVCPSPTLQNVLTAFHPVYF